MDTQRIGSELRMHSFFVARAFVCMLSCLLVV